MSLTRTCRISGKEFIISNQEISLLEKLSPIIGGEKFKLPLPFICPEERRRRKFPYKNYLSLFKRADSTTGEAIISSYPPDSIYTVYSQPHWWSDSWNALDFGREYSPTQSVTEQIHSVFLQVPVPALDNAYRDTENSEYINGCGPSKDCYLTSNSAYNERCLYGWNIFHSNNILDSNYVQYSEFSSHSEHIWKCYNVHYAWDASECRDSRYIFSCNGCSNLLGCIGQKNQKYQILNTPCSKEEFEGTLEKIQTDTTFRKDFEQKVQKLIEKIGLEGSIKTRSVDSSGDFCYDSKDAFECYNVSEIEDSIYITDSFNTKDSAHISMWGDGTTLSYDSIDVGLNVSNIYYSTACWEWARYNFYCHKCNNCQYIFGCSGLRNKSYCIFNKQYSKEEWEVTVKKIIKQMEVEGTWGEFLSPGFAPFAYNESLGQNFAPIEKDEVEKKGFRWSDREESIPEGISKVIPGERIPDSITDIPDDVLNWAIKCPLTKKYFQIQPIELEMCRKFQVPISKIHPITRIQKRLEWDKRVFDFRF